MADKPAEATEAEAYKANDAEANDADKAIVANEIEANVIDEADAAGNIIVIDKPIKAEEAEANEVAESNNTNEVDKVGVTIETPLLLTFSLTKYPAIFAEVKGSFGVNNNQLGGLKGGCLSPCSLMIRFVCGVRESIFKNI